MSGGDEVATFGVPSLRLVNNAAPRYDRKVVRDVATMAVDAAICHAVHDVTQAVAQASQLTNALRGELISQAVVKVAPSTATSVQESEQIPVANSSEILRLAFQPPIGAIHAVAKTTVEAITSKAVLDVTQAVKNATDWLEQAVRIELISQVVAPNMKTIPDSGVSADTSMVSHKDVAIQNVTEWIAMAMRNTNCFPTRVDTRLSCENSVEPERHPDRVHELTKRHDIPHILLPQEKSLVSDIHEVAKATIAAAILTAVQNVSQSVADDVNMSCEISAELQSHPDVVIESTKLHDIPRIPLGVEKPPAADIRELAKLTVDAAICRAVQRLAQRIVSERPTQDVIVKVPEQPATIAPHEKNPEVEDTEPLKTNYLDTVVADGSDISPEASEKPVYIPELRLPQSHHTSDEVGKCFEVAAPFVKKILSSALELAATPRSIVEPQDDEEDYYTPIPTPTSEDTSREDEPVSISAPKPEPTPALPTPTLASAKEPEPVLLSSAADLAPAKEPEPVSSTTTAELVPATEAEAIQSIPTPDPTSPTEPEPVPPIILPPAQVIERATPPETKPTPRLKSPIMSNRGLGSPRSAPPALPSSPAIDETPMVSPLQSPLPPVVIHGVHGPQPSSRAKPHQHKSPHKTPQPPTPNRRADFQLGSPRAATSDSSNKKHTPRASIELELSPRSSARAAALIYAQSPSSSRQSSHHHHKTKKERDSQTTPLSSPPPFPQHLAHEDHNDNRELSLTSQKKHFPLNLSSPGNENGVRKNPTLLPLPKAPVHSSPTKSPSPSRVNKPHHQSPTRKANSESSVLSPPTKTRSGYCQRCVYEGRSCKINDCLKHQVLK